ncbi:hypothetical protein L7F22_055070 [Adiantum nelumboides]|nr:hypothetical protein [Adiantum nelumboides]
METNAGQEDKENGMTKEEENDFEEKHVENVLGEEKSQKDPLLTTQDTEVYVPEISWDDDGNHIDPYEAYQSFIKEYAYANSFKGSYLCSKRTYHPLAALAVGGAAYGIERLGNHLYRHRRHRYFPQSPSPTADGFDHLYGGPFHAASHAEDIDDYEL